MFALYCQSIFNKEKPVCLALADSREVLEQVILDNIREPYQDDNVLPLAGDAGVTRYFKPGPLFDYHIPFKAACGMCGPVVGIVSIHSREEIVKEYEKILQGWDDKFSKVLKIEAN